MNNAQATPMTRNQRAAQKLLDYCADKNNWLYAPSPLVIEALRILSGKPLPPDLAAKGGDRG